MFPRQSYFAKAYLKMLNWNRNTVPEFNLKGSMKLIRLPKNELDLMTAITNLLGLTLS